MFGVVGLMLVVSSFVTSATLTCGQAVTFPRSLIVYVKEWQNVRAMLFILAFSCVLASFPALEAVTIVLVRLGIMKDRYRPVWRYGAPPSNKPGAEVPRDVVLGIMYPAFTILWVWVTVRANVLDSCLGGG